jgi:hypothetical protein
LRECMKLKEEVKREQGLAALAFGKFAEEYEIEGGRRLEIGCESEVEGV